jgi:hypothetical protein
MVVMPVFSRGAPLVLEFAAIFVFVGAVLSSRVVCCFFQIGAEKTGQMAANAKQRPQCRRR